MAATEVVGPFLLVRATVATEHGDGYASAARAGLAKPVAVVAGREIGSVFRTLGSPRRLAV